MPSGNEERRDKINDDITLIQKKNGLVFGTDAYLLSCFVRRCARGYAADLGTGTGVCALLCAARGRFLHIDAVELQAEFADIAKRNVEYNGFSHKICVHLADVKEITSAAFGRELDAVFFNPPYMKSGSGKKNASDMKSVARHDDYGTVFDFCAAAARIAKFGADIYAVYRPERLCDLLCAMRECGIEPKEIVFVHADDKKAPSLVLARGKKGAAAGLTVRPPLIIYEDSEHREYTDEYKRIYETGELRYAGK